MTWKNGTDLEYKSGGLMTIHSIDENDNVSWHYMNVTQSGTSVYYPYAFIGMRKGCRYGIDFFYKIFG